MFTCTYLLVYEGSEKLYSFYQYICPRTTFLQELFNGVNICPVSALKRMVFFLIFLLVILLLEENRRDNENVYTIKNNRIDLQF